LATSFGINGHFQANIYKKKIQNAAAHSTEMAIFMGSDLDSLIAFISITSP